MSDFSDAWDENPPAEFHAHQQNREANDFARQLLMPESLVRDWMRKHQNSKVSTVRLIASDFGVTEGLAGARLLELGYDVGSGA